MENTQFDYLKNEGFTDEQISYLKQCSDRKDWEEYDIQRRWIAIIGDMTQILYEWDQNKKSQMVS